MMRCMKIFAGITAIFIFQAPAVLAATFQDANARFEAGEYKEASQIYEALVAQKKSSAVVYYNLGNTYFRLKQRGKALLNYERARRLAPRDADIRWNIEVVKTTLMDKIQTEQGSFVLNGLKSLTRRVTADETTLLFTAILLLFFVLTIFNFFVAPLRPSAGPLQGIVFLVLIATAVLGIIQWLDEKDPRVVILKPEVFARYGPSKEETKAFLIHEGAEGRVIDESKEWLDIKLPDGQSGWIPKTTCEVV